MLKQVVLPAPLGPIRPVIRPAAISKLQSLTATRPPKRRSRCSTFSIGRHRNRAGIRRSTVSASRALPLSRPKALPPQVALMRTRARTPRAVLSILPRQTKSLQGELSGDFIWVDRRTHPVGSTGGVDLDCPSCGAENAEGKRFCGDCGTPLVLRCPACGAESPPGKKFCGDCGADLTKPSAASAPSPERRSPRPEAERRQLTVMFVRSGRLDRAGGAARSRGSARGDRAPIRAPCAEVIGRFEGHVAKYMGDGVLAYFGYPQAHEDDAERAVRAGLALDRGGRPAATPPTVAPLAARIGIATGQVVVGDLIGEGAAQEQAVVGETPNLAARLQALAAPGGVVIGPGTRAAGRRPVRARPTSARSELKGFAAPVQAWRVVGDSRAESRFEARSATGLTPFVGREHELGMLLDRWRAGQGRRGPGGAARRASPGSASRASRASCASASTSEPHIRLRYQCSPLPHDSALHPVIEQLERAAGFAPRRPARGQARQARGAARRAAPTGSTRRAADRRAARPADRRALPAARADPAAAEASARSRRWSTSSKGSRPTGRC